jgi:hypothetical protein
MSNFFQLLIEQVLENMNTAGAGGVFGVANVYGNPEAFEQESTYKTMAIAGKNVTKKGKKKVKKKKTPIIRRTFPETIWKPATGNSKKE